MSYLLTEIALELLGNKFYDVNGVCRETNFTSLNLGHLGPEIAGEPNLREVLMLSDEDINGKAAKNDSEVPAEDQEVISLDDQPTAEHGDEFRKRVDKECEKIKDGIDQNKVNFLQSSKYFITQASNTISPEDILRPFTDQETVYIRNELENMQNYRKNVEEQLSECIKNIKN